VWGGIARDFKTCLIGVEDRMNAPMARYLLFDSGVIDQMNSLDGIREWKKHSVCVTVTVSGANLHWAANRLSVLF
jgi:hypothetical protein